MRVCFRVDASSEIGAGHLVRCLALALELRSSGCEVAFFSQALPARMAAWVEAAAFPHFLLTGERATPGPLDEDEDARDFVHAARQVAGVWDWIVADHYRLGARWERITRTIANHLAAIDDLADRAHEVDLLVDPNYPPDRSGDYVGLVWEGCQLRVGPAYALLRPPFRAARASGRQRDGAIRRVLVCFGGGGTTSYSSLALEALDPLDSIAVHVIGGSEIDGAVARSLRRRASLRWSESVNEMARPMAEADLFVGSGGGITWERFCLGLPGIVLSVAANQRATSSALASDGYQIYLGDAQALSASTLRSAIERLLGDPGSVRALSIKGQGLVDGEGARRIAQAMHGWR